MDGSAIIEALGAAWQVPPGALVILDEYGKLVIDLP
jgi:hypothetical protein